MNVEKMTSLPKLPPRKADAHKGDFGHVLVVGGSRGMIGAPAMAANAALRGGAGLVTVAVPQDVQLFVATLCPCATSIPLSCGKTNDFVAGAVREMLDAAKRCDVLAVGPGMGAGVAQENLIHAAIGQELPLVLDADGLNNLAKIDDWPTLRRCPLVLTPHVGEFARLTRRSVTEIQADRVSAALDAAGQWSIHEPPLTVVLKGAGSVVTDGRRLFVNDTGNPAMATGGSGDVLTGLLAAMIGQGLSPFESACLAVNIHGRAGDLAAEALGETSLIATDLLDYLAAALKQCDS